MKTCVVLAFMAALMSCGSTGATGGAGADGGPMAASGSQIAFPQGDEFEDVWSSGDSSGRRPGQTSARTSAARGFCGELPKDRAPDVLGFYTVTLGSVERETRGPPTLHDPFGWNHFGRDGKRPRQRRRLGFRLWVPPHRWWRGTQLDRCRLRSPRGSSRPTVAKHVLWCWTRSSRASMARAR
jgi:hypothetical protein